MADQSVHVSAATQGGPLVEEALFKWTTPEGRLLSAEPGMTMRPLLNKAYEALKQVDLGTLEVVPLCGMMKAWSQKIHPKLGILPPTEIEEWTDLWAYIEAIRA